MAIKFSTLEARVTKLTADSPVAGTDFDSSTLSEDCMIVVRVRSLRDTTGAVVPKAVFTLVWDNGDAAKHPFLVKEIVGTVSPDMPSGELKFSISQREFQAATRGTAGDKLNLQVVIPTANTEVIYEAFVIH